MKALHDTVIVIPDRFPDKIGLIIMPDSTKEDRTNFGTVVAVGKENKEIKIDDRVLYSKFHGTEFDVCGVRHLVLEKDEVDCIVDN